MIAHHCVVCKSDYNCPYCHTPQSFICPTLNDDEDANMCDACLDKAAEDMQKWADEQDNP
jgi:hypothetical protein